MKCNEAGAFRKTYDHIIGRLKDEKRHFDVQLAQAMETLRAKEADLAELIQMSNDAHRAKEAAKAELAKLELTIAEERKIRQKELAERRKLVQAMANFERPNANLEQLAFWGDPRKICLAFPCLNATAVRRGRRPESHLRGRPR